ncbi:MAG: signal peptidase I [Patescibacteria group bacterium]
MNERSYDNQPPELAEVARERPKSNFWKEIVKFTFITLIIVIPFRLYIAQPFIVSGASMDPTFADGEYLIVDQISKRLEAPKRESVIIFKYPKDTSKFFIKRIIGLPGETVKITDGVVTIFNSEFPKDTTLGLTLNEPYVAGENKKGEDFTVVLSDSEYFVLGDNRLGSFDSRSWGPVQKNLIVGRPIVRLLPITRLNFSPGDFSN